MDPKKMKYSGLSGTEHETVHRMRVNSTFLHQYHGKPICVLGTVTKAEGGGTAFQMKASDGNQINIRLKSPISEPLSGLIEVYGIGQGKNLVLADNFTTFPDNIAADFDMTIYNELVNLLNTKEKDNAWKPAN